jgi:pilus assembly protein CpaB
MERRARQLALGMASLAALLLLWLVGNGSHAFAGGATRSLVVVTRDLAPGELIQRAALDFRDLPEAYVEDRHIAAEDVERLIGMRATTPVVGGASLLWTDLDAGRPGRTLSGLVQVGMRALSLPELGFDGLLRPGDRADVLFTPRVPEDGSPDDQPTVTLLENVLVLGVGRELGTEVGRPAREAAAEAGRVTLSVSPREAQRIAHTQGRGTLRLSLRNPHDVAVAEVFEHEDRGEP